MGNREAALIDNAEKVLNKLENKTISSIHNMLDISFSRLEKKLLQVFDNVSESSTVPAIRLRVMLGELGDLLNLVNPETAKFYEARLQELIEEAHRQGIDLSEKMVKAIDPDALLNASVNFEAAAFVAKNAADRLKNHSESFRLTAIQIIGYNLLIGSGSRKTAGLLRNALGVTKGRAEAIARTETMSALNEAADQFYADNAIDYVQLFTTADDRTCRFCGARNQSIYKRGDLKVPLHVKCRCYLTPVKPQWIDNDLIDLEWSNKYFNEAKPDQLDQGLAPFEKSNGLSSPPSPVWKPGDDKPTF